MSAPLPASSAVMKTSGSIEQDDEPAAVGERGSGTSSGSVELDDFLRKLAVNFRSQAAGDVETMRDLAFKLADATGHRNREAALSALRVLAHRLAGRGGTFGFPMISTRASAVEVAIDDLLPQVATVPADRIEIVLGLVANLCTEIDSL